MRSGISSRAKAATSVGGRRAAAEASALADAARARARAQIAAARATRAIDAEHRARLQSMWPIAAYPIRAPRYLGGRVIPALPAPEPGDAVRTLVQKHFGRFPRTASGSKTGRRGRRRSR